MTPCRLVCRYQCFSRVCCFQLQSSPKRFATHL